MFLCIMIIFKKKKRNVLALASCVVSIMLIISNQYHSLGVKRVLFDISFQDLLCGGKWCKNGVKLYKEIVDIDL